MVNYNISEGTAEDELATNPDIKTGDTITYISNNQAGYLKYKVVVGSEGERTLKLIDSYAHQMGDYDIDTDNNGYNTDEEEKDSQNSQSGGKRRKTNKRKNNNKRKTNKRKTNKRKTNKRKTNKRK
jgi:hypothetical protein